MSAPGGSVPGGSAPGGVSAPGEGSVPGGSALGGVCLSAFWDTTPPCEQNDKQVQKYYLGHNFVAAGKNEVLTLLPPFPTM